MNETILTEIKNSDEQKLVPLLNYCQSKLGYIPKEAFETISEKINIPLSQAYSVATFFTDFFLKPIGKHKIEICNGTSCYVRGSEKIFDHLSRKLNIAEDETTEDRLFTLKKVRCIGCCSLSPAMRIDDEVYGRVSSEKAEKIIEKIRQKEEKKNTIQ